MCLGRIHGCLLSPGMLSTNKWKSTASVRWDPVDWMDLEPRGFTECVHDILLDGGIGEKATHKRNTNSRSSCLQTQKEKGPESHSTQCIGMGFTGYFSLCAHLFSQYSTTNISLKPSYIKGGGSQGGEERSTGHQ